VTDDARTPVLFVNTATAEPLGADTWVHVEIIRQLDRSTHEVIAACATGPSAAATPTYAALTEIPDLEIVPVDLGPELSGVHGLRARVRVLLATLPAIPSVVRLAWLVRRRRVLVLHTSDRPRDAFTCVVIARLTGATSIVHCHQLANPATGRLLQWSIHHADVVVAVSEFVGRSFVAAGIPPERVAVVLNGVDVDRWHPGRDRASTRAELGIGPDAPVLLSVCRLFPGKGAASVIHALPELLDELPDLRLLIVGSDVLGGSYRAELRTLITSLGLDDHVELLGRRPDIPALMAAADVYVMPSVDEPFGLVFAEAMAMELPVVGLTNGGTLEIVEDGVTGLLSSPGDGPALVDHLRRLLGDPALRATMGRRGRRVVEARFTTTRVAADAARLYASIASGRRRGRARRTGPADTEPADGGRTEGLGARRWDRYNGPVLPARAGRSGRSGRSESSVEARSGAPSRGR
jgi:glycosyltransferase involved in cell wall biosynthesis